MSDRNGWAPQVPLGELLLKNNATTDIVADGQYREVTVKLWGRGVVERRTALGSEIAAHRRSVIRANQFIMSRIDARNGAIGIVPNELDGAVVSNDFPTFDTAPNRLLPSYLGWLSKTHSFVEFCRQASEGTTNRVRLKEDVFLRQSIPTPPIAEQRRIVAKIERFAEMIDESRDLRCAAVAKSNALLSCSLHAAIEKFTSDLELVPLRKYVVRHDSGWSPQCENFPAMNGEWAVLKTTCVQWSGFEASANKALGNAMAPRPEICVRRGDVLITRAGPMNRVGVACVVQEDHDRLMLSDKIVRLRMSDDVEPAFVPLILRSHQCQEYFRRGKTGLAASQVNISREKLLDLPVIMPSRCNQQMVVEAYLAIAARLRESDEQRTRVAERLEVMLPSILDRAFRGKL